MKFKSRDSYPNRNIGFNPTPLFISLSSFEFQGTPTMDDEELTAIP